MPKKGIQEKAMIKDLEFVIFDMDGLMFDTERRYCEASEKGFSRLGIRVDMQALYDAVGGSAVLDYQRFNLSSRPDEEIRSLNRKMFCYAVDDMCQNGVPLKKGLLELMKKLSEKKIRMAVATSTRPDCAERLLRAAGVYEFLEFVITASEVAHGKPAPDIFRKACELAKASPERILILEDSVNGGRAARDAGIPYIIIPDLVRPTKDVAEAAYGVMESLLDVADII